MQQWWLTNDAYFYYVVYYAVYVRLVVFCVIFIEGEELELSHIVQKN